MKGLVNYDQCSAGIDLTLAFSAATIGSNHSTRLRSHKDILNYQLHHFHLNKRLDKLSSQHDRKLLMITTTRAFKHQRNIINVHVEMSKNYLAMHKMLSHPQPLARLPKYRYF